MPYLLSNCDEVLKKRDDFSFLKLMAKKYFTQRQLKNLDIFEYKSTCHSILTNLILSPLYSALVYVIPTSITPNQITIFNGIMYTLFTVVYAASYYSDQHPLLTKVFNQQLFLNLSVNEIFESYGFYLHAGALVLYQALDSLDGKQARRTNNSTPAGHLLDHGIDALVTGLVCVNLYYLMGLTNNQFYAYLSCCLTVFFLNTWEEFHTKVLYFGVISGCVEGLFSMAGLLILFPSKDHWHYKLIQNPQVISYVELVCKYVLQIIIQTHEVFHKVLAQLSTTVNFKLIDVATEFIEHVQSTLVVAISFFNKSKTKDAKIPLQPLYDFLVGKQGLFNFSTGMTLVQLVIIISIVFSTISCVACIFNVFKKKGITGLLKTTQSVPFFTVNAAILYYLIDSPLVESPKQFVFLVFGWIFSLAYANVSITCARILNLPFPTFPKVYLGYILLILLKLVHLDVIP